MKTITVGDFTIELEFKNVKNFNMRITADGKIKLSAPKRQPESAARAFAFSHREWIAKHLPAAAAPDRAFCEDGGISVFGKFYRLERADGGYSLALGGETALLRAPGGADTEAALKKTLAKLLAERIEERIAYWSGRTGLTPSGFAVRDMRTRWGSCNVITGKLCFNLQLVRKPPVCLDYVVVHELGHLVNRNHDARFHHYMDVHFPDWRAVRKILNSAPLDKFPQK